MADLTDNVQRLERVLVIDGLLRSGAYPSRTTLAGRFEMTPRSVSRDIDFLRDRLGAPVAYDRSKGGYYYTDPSYFLPDISLTEGELLATLVSASGLANVFGGELESAAQKMTARLPDPVKVSLARVAGQLDFHQGANRSLDLTHFSTIRSALGSRPLWMRYFSAHRSEVSERVVEPLHLRFHLGDWYLVAYCRERRDYRTFAVSRVLDVKSQSSPFGAHPDFDPDSYFESALGVFTSEKATVVTIRFSSGQASWVAERTWHPSQALEWRQDGSLELTLEVAVGAELVQWILGYGAQAVVVRPQALADLIVREAQAILERYQEVS